MNPNALRSLEELAALSDVVNDYIRQLDSLRVATELGRLRSVLNDTKLRDVLESAGLATDIQDKIGSLSTHLTSANSLVTNPHLRQAANSAVDQIVGTMAVARASELIERYLADTASSTRDLGYFRVGDLFGVSDASPQPSIQDEPSTEPTKSVA